MASNPAPGELELVRGFVNTKDAEDETEVFTTVTALRDWLADQGLLSGGARAGTVDLANALALREAIRAILLHHDGEPLDPTAPHVLDAAARRARLSVVFDDHGAALTDPLAGGVDGALGRLLAIVAVAQREGTWTRLKVCPADDCLWAFYDRSKNRSARWCDSRDCGNVAKQRAFRERQRANS